MVENANKVKKALKNKKIDIAINTNWPFIGPFMKFLENTGVMKELKKITAKQIRKMLAPHLFTILFTSCVSGMEPATTSGMAVTSGEISLSEATPASVSVSESPPDIEPDVDSDLNQYSLPDGFVYVADVIPTAQLEIRYFSNDNFTGTVIDGYEAPKAILTTEAAQALKIAADKRKW